MCSAAETRKEFDLKEKRVPSFSVKVAQSAHCHSSLSVSRLTSRHSPATWNTIREFGDNVSSHCRRKSTRESVTSKRGSLLYIARENQPRRERGDTTHLGADCKLETERAARMNELPAKSSASGRVRVRPKTNTYRGKAVKSYRVSSAPNFLIVGMSVEIFIGERGDTQENP